MASGGRAVLMGENFISNKKAGKPIKLPIQQYNVMNDRLSVYQDNSTDTSDKEQNKDNN